MLWCGGHLCEERGSDETTVMRRLLGLGEQLFGESRFFGSDHLGSLRTVSDEFGSLSARYDFDPWGRMTTTVGSASRLGYGNYVTTFDSGLLLTRFRAYDPDEGRWLPEDPIEDETVQFTLGIERSVSPIEPFDNTTAEGYVFVRNQPLALVDIDGLYAGCTLLEQRCDASKRIYSFSWGVIRWVDVCTLRYCKWRCYQNKTGNCYDIPCRKKNCQLDHGVEVVKKTVRIQRNRLVQRLYAGTWSPSRRGSETDEKGVDATNGLSHYFDPLLRRSTLGECTRLSDHAGCDALWIAVQLPSVGRQIRSRSRVSAVVGRCARPRHARVVSAYCSNTAGALDQWRTVTPVVDRGVLTPRVNYRRCRSRTFAPSSAGNRMYVLPLTRMAISPPTAPAPSSGTPAISSSPSTAGHSVRNSATTGLAGASTNVSTTTAL